MSQEDRVRQQDKPPVTASQTGKQELHESAASPAAYQVASAVAAATPTEASGSVEFDSAFQSLLSPPSRDLSARPSQALGAGRSGDGSVVKERAEPIKYEHSELELNTQQDQVEGARNSAGIAKRPLSPDSFRSLAEAFQSSLHVIRCLRKALQLIQGAQQRELPTCGLQGNQEGNEEQTLLAGRAALAAELVASQEAFAAHEAAYAGLINSSASPPAAACDKMLPTPGNAIASEAASSCPVTGTTGGEGVAGRLQDKDMLPAVAQSAGHGAADQAVEESSLGSTAAPSALEYELSVCKALLLLHQLTPNSVTTTEEIFSSTYPAPAASQFPGRQARQAQSVHSVILPSSSSTVGQKSAELLRYRKDLSAGVLLDALLRVRLLQGTQQLLRADFMKLLHQHRKHHQLLQQALQTTVTRLEAERDSLLGRMHKLSAMVSRK
ncbi:hypothetical protein Efla_003804 [Eimeria flavescens]